MSEMMLMRRTVLLLTALGMWAAFAGVNFFPNPGFETWDAERGLPTEKGWSMQVAGTNGFTVLERSTAERHSGEASLHLKDANGGPFNHVLAVSLGSGVAKQCRGKVLRASCWIKQVDASAPRILGLQLRAKAKSGSQTNMNGPGSCGAVDWNAYAVKLVVPEDATDIEVSFPCVHGFYGTGEAYFDDVVVSLDKADHPVCGYIPATERVEHRAHYEPLKDADEELAAYRKRIREQPPTEEDGRERPEIVDGNLVLKGSPQFYVGVWFGNSFWLKSNPLKIDHFAYQEPFSKQLFDDLGFNSSQLSAAHGSQGALLRGFPLPVGKWFQKDWFAYNWHVQEKMIGEFYRGFGDFPLVVDFAFGPKDRYPRELAKLIDQRHRGWHAFIPFCPESPEGDLYYRSYFQGGARSALRHGANIFCYELFNESSYDCECRYNFEEFVRRMEKRYGTIERANATWGTIFDDWGDVLRQCDYRQYPGVWYDWCRFLSARYVEVLRRYRDVLRSCDHRKNVYFTEQASGAPPMHPTMDYRDIAQELDILTLEGGFSFGVKTAIAAKDEMADVVAAGGMRHVYNCDFFRALAKGRKPVVNNEHYCVRTENGERVPSKRSDYKTALWLEVMHGVSGDFTYQLGARPWEERTLEEAHENVRKVTYKSSSLLNPFNVKPEDLSAFKEFRAELEPYRELVLPHPRVKPATVAVFFSKPTEIFKDALPKVKPYFWIPHFRNPRDTIMPGWYTALVHAYYPVKVVFEEDLDKLGSEVGAVVVPDAPYLTEAALASLRRAAKRLPVIAAKGSFERNEWGRPIMDDTSFATVVDSPAAAVAALERAKVARYAALEAVDGDSPIREADVEVCDRGDRKLILLVAMGETKERSVRLRLPFVQDDTRRYRVVNAVTGTSVAAPRGDSWSADELVAGIPLSLPPQERVVLLLHRE